MPEETKIPSSASEKKSIIDSVSSLILDGNNKWFALGVVGVIIVALLWGFGIIGGKVAATVNGKKIYLSEVEKLYSGYEKQFTQANSKQKITKDQEINIKSLLLDRLIRTELVSQAAEKEGIEVKQSDVDKNLKQIKQSTSPEALKKGLEQMGWTEKDLEEQVKANLVETKLREAKTKSIKITDKDAEKYYSQNKITYKVPETATVQIAKVTKKADADKMASEANSDFTKAAKKYAKTGYQKQPLTKDQITGLYSKELASAIFGASNGSMTSVIKVNGGYAVAKVEKKETARQKSYKEVKKEILTTLKAQKEQEAFDKFIEDYKKNAKVEILIADLKPQQQQLPTGPPSGGGK